MGLDRATQDQEGTLSWVLQGGKKEIDMKRQRSISEMLHKASKRGVEMEETGKKDMDIVKKFTPVVDKVLK